MEKDNSNISKKKKSARVWIEVAVVLLCIGLAVAVLSEKTAAQSAEQCGLFVDSVAFFGGGSKAANVQRDAVWTVGTNCTEASGETVIDCYIKNITAYTRMLDIGATGGGTILGYAQMSNTSQKDCVNASNAAYTRYIAYKNFPKGQAATYYDDCGLDSGGPNTCSLSIGNGYTDEDCYSVRAYGEKFALLDVFNLNYTWCYTEVLPKVENQSVGTSVNASNTTAQGGWGDTFNFTLFARDPNSDNLNVTAYYNETPSLTGATRLSESPCPKCQNFTSTSILFKGFTCGDIGKRYYMFNATDNDTVNGPFTRLVDPDLTHFFTVLKDKISFSHVAGNASVTNRGATSGDTFVTLTLYGNDTTNNSAILRNTTITLKVTNDNSTYNTIGTNTSHDAGNISFSFGATCSPTKYEVGLQKWKFTTDGSTQEYPDQDCYDSAESIEFYVNVTDDFNASLDSHTNGTEIDTDANPTVTFSGSVVDSCGYVTGANMSFDIYGPSGFHFLCNESSNDVTTGIWSQDSDSYDCLWNTSNKVAGFYNATFLGSKPDYDANASDVITFKLTGAPKLNNPEVTPNNGPWGAQQKFNVTASAGDDDRTLFVKAWISNDAPTYTVYTQIGSELNCTGQGCGEMNFTYNFSGCSDKETWKFKFNSTSTGGNAESSSTFTTLVQDNVELELMAGSGSSMNETDGAVLAVRVRDSIRNVYDLTPENATVYFNVSGRVDQLAGSNETNDVGNASFNFRDDSCLWSPGPQQWKAFTSGDECYANNETPTTYSININTPCAATLDISQFKTPNFGFQNKSFGLNLTVTSSLDESNDTLAKIRNLPDGWKPSPNETINLTYIGSGLTKDGSYGLLPNSSGAFTINISVNNSQGLNESDTFSITIYKWQVSSTPEQALLYDTSGFLNCSDNICNVTEHVSSIDATPGSSLDSNVSEAQLTQGQSPREYVVARWGCEAGDYEYSNLTINAEGVSATSNVRISSFNGSDYEPVYRKDIDDNAERIGVGILSGQMVPEGGFCKIKIENIGSNDLMVDYLSLEMYYTAGARIKDIIPNVNGIATTGIEPNDGFLNVTIQVENALAANYTFTLELNITNSSGGMVNSSRVPDLNITGYTSLEYNFTNINTSAWSIGNYRLEAYVTGGLTTQKREDFVFMPVEIANIKASRYRCNGTNEYFNVTIYHPFTDKISYNISLGVPTNWSFTPAFRVINRSTAGNFTVQFNVTSSQGTEVAGINATANYTFLGSGRNKSNLVGIETSQSIPILEVFREVPTEAGNNLQFNSRLLVRNKGCALAEDISFVEKVASGWTAYGQTLDGTSTGTTDIPKGEIRLGTSQFGTIAAGEYKTIQYNILSHSSQAQRGTIRYNLTWGARNISEDREYEITTINYTGEKHLSFDLVSVGQSTARKRSADPSDNQTYNFTITNIGDAAIIANAWNASLLIPGACNATNYTGTFDPSTRKITWQLGALAKEAVTNFEFVMNCTEETRYLLYAEGFNDTRATQIYRNTTAINCSGASCFDEKSFTFSDPNQDYQRISSIDFYINHSWNGFNLTIARSSLNITDDSGRDKLVWQAFSFNNNKSQKWINYSLTEEEQQQFKTTSRNIGVRSFTDAASEEAGTVRLENISYLWNHGRLFGDTQPLMVNIKTFVFVPDAPTLEAPPNASTQASENVVISWLAVSGATSYFVFGDAVDGTTLLSETTVTNYLWSGLSAGTYYWKVIASTGTQNSTSSQMWQFTVNTCAPGGGAAADYPMSFDNYTQRITVWGSNGSDGKTQMGANASDPITFKDIFDFG
ncbi:MAG TPA: hypothetical protein VJB08_04990, partial [Candidatus Nanoarchaeia archaeon]|nr:hypothetical protein [Candidatus Nanoarchaeia archaeon]